MSELEPITREEMLLDGQDLEPITREEMFIKRIYDKTQVIPTPVTRKEMFLKKAGEGGGGVDVEQLEVSENGTYSEQGKAYSPVIVSVPTLTAEEKTITANGDYTAPSGKAYTPVHVAVPLPQNAYLKKTATTSMSDAEQLPCPSAKVSVTDKDKAELFFTSDGVVSEDNTPYTYRQSPSGKSCVDLSIVGGTVAWNQLVQNGDFANTTGWYAGTATMSVSNNVMTVSGTTNSFISLYCYSGYNIQLSNAHKYLIKAKVSSTGSGDIAFLPTGAFTGGSKAFSPSSTPKDVGFVYSANSTTEGTMQIRFIASSGTSENITATIEKYNCIDLTQAFGSTIADYVYTLEQATAGSGIAWLKSYGYLTKDYYAYDSGSLQSVNVASRKVVGFNQWDEEWEVGNINGETGENASGSTIRSKNHIPVIPNTTYYLCGGSGAIYNYVNILQYDSSMSYLGSNSIIFKYLNNNFTVSSKCRYIRFVTGAGSTYNNNICINISDTAKNGQYEPYTSTTYDFDSSKILRGIPKLNNGNLYYDGDTYESDGTVTRNYGVRAYESGDESLANAITDGTNTVYKLSTPTTESATPFTNPQLVGSTEEFVDAQTTASTPTRDVDIPVGQDSKYVNGNIYIKYLDSVTTGEIELADENAIIPLEDTTYISSNGSASVDYWSKEE